MKNRKSVRTYSAATTFAVAGLAAVAAAQPASTNLGSLPNGTTNITATATGVASTNVIWFRFTLPNPVTAADGFLDITCTAGTPPLSNADSEIGLYTAAGAFRATDDDDSVGNYSELSFGRTSPTRVTVTGAVGGNGRDGVLAAGTYYLAVSPFNATFSSTGTFNVTTTSAATGNVNVALSYLGSVAPTNPTGIGSATPAGVQPGQSTLLRVVVSPGTAPVSTGITVTGNLSTVGGSATQQFYDDGTNGDVTAGDNTFSYSYTVPGAQATGSFTLPFSIADAQFRTGSGNITLGVFVPPAADDLGTLPLGTTTGPTETLALAQVKFYKFTLAGPVSNAGGTFLDIVTTTVSGGGTFINDSIIGLYRADGTLAASDDDDGPDANSALSFGLTAPTRPNGNGPVFDGRDGTLAAGTYYLALSLYNASFGANFNAVSTSNSTGTEFASLTLGPAPNTPPTIVGNTSTGLAGGTVLITGTVAGGANPASTGLAVTGNLTPIGGSATQTFYDDATHGDVTAGDNIFSYTATLPAAQTSTTVTLTVTDAQARTGTGTATINVDEAGETIATARNIDGAGAITSIAGVLSNSDADIYRIHICTPGSFDASTVGGTTVDTQLFLFNPSGTGVAMNDDDAVTGVLQSHLNGPLVTGIAAGDYYLAISQYDKDPVDSAAAALWLDTPFNTVRAPDGPAAANPLAGFDAGGGTGGTYTITLAGVSGTPCGPVCGTADFNGDGDIGTDQDIEAFFACLAGNCCAMCFPGGADFNGDGDIGTDQDIEAFFRVLAGNAC